MRRFPINYLPTIKTYTFSLNGNSWASTATIFQAMQQVHLTLAWVLLCPHNFRITCFSVCIRLSMVIRLRCKSWGFYTTVLCFRRPLPLQKASREHCIKWWSSWQEAVALGLFIAPVEEQASWGSCMKCWPWIFCTIIWNGNEMGMLPQTVTIYYWLVFNFDHR